MLKSRPSQRLSFQEPSPFELYLPPGRGPFPLICLTPILGRLLFLEDLFLERRFAQFFQAQGFAVALIERPIFEFNPAKGIEQIQEYLDESVERNKRVLDHLIRKKEINPQRIGSFGISFGAVINCLWASSEARLKAHVFTLAGGNIPEIILTSRDPLMRSYLKAVKKKVTGTFLVSDTFLPFGGESPPQSAADPPRLLAEKKVRGDLKTALQRTIQSDPLKLCHSIPTENVLMNLAIFDRVIRFRFGLALWRALGKPETVFLPLGHYASILAWPILKWRTLAFFRRKLTNKFISDNPTT